MRPTRRGMLAGLSASAVFPACKGDGDDSGDSGPPAAPEREPEPDDWEPEGEESEAFAWGVQAGDATAEGALLSVRTSEQEVELVVVEADGDDWEEVVRATVTVEEGLVRYELTDLSPVMNSVPITDFSDLFGEVEADDRWQGFPEAREEVLAWIDEQGVSGVLWLAGDVHFGQVAKVGVPGSGLGEEQWEVCAGPAGSPITPVSLYEDESGQYPLLLSQHNSVLLRLDPGLGEITVTHVGDDGEVLGEHVLVL